MKNFFSFVVLIKVFRIIMLLRGIIKFVFIVDL